MNDYISRIDLGIGKCNPDIFENKDYAEGWNAAVGIIEAAPPADVRPVRLINAGIETALQILDGINEEGWLPYPVYSELHDAISVIGEYAQSGADMREAAT